MSVPTVLENILARKVQEVAERSARVSLSELESLAKAADAPVVLPRHCWRRPRRSNRR